MDGWRMIRDENISKREARLPDAANPRDGIEDEAAESEKSSNKGMRGPKNCRDPIEKQRAGRIPKALAERVRRMFWPRGQEDPWQAGPRACVDTIIAEEIPPATALLLLCDLPEDWRTAFKRAIFGGFPDAVERVEGVRIGVLWDLHDDRL